MFVITGASEGLGFELAKLLVAKGKKVVSLSRHDPKAQGVDWLEVDLTKGASIELAAKQLGEGSEPIEALINCAGVMTRELVGHPPEFAELDQLFRTNVTGAILLTDRLLERIQKDEADIVNVASTAGAKASAQIAYGSSKWAMRGYSANLQLLLKDTPCRVISFCPGGFRSRIAEKAFGVSPSDPENWMLPEDVALCLLQILELPKNMQVSEIIIDRKKAKS